MEFTIDLGVGGWVLLIVGAVLLGGIAQFIGDVRAGYEWIVTAVAAFLGGLVASEFIVAWREFEPLVDGLAIVPAIIGALVVGIVVDAITRYATHGSYMGHAPV